MKKSKCARTVCALAALVLSLLLLPGSGLAGLPDGLPPMPDQTLSDSAGGGESTSSNDDLNPPAVPADWWAAVQDQVLQSEYEITWQDHTNLSDLGAGAYHAANRAQNLRIYFSPTGPAVIPRVWPEGAETPPWEWSVSLAGWGSSLETLRPPAAAALNPDGNRLEYRRGDLVEWYVNGGEGLQQGFTALAPPASPSAGPLALALSLAGDLTPRPADGGASVEFITRDGEPALRYGDVHAVDAAGRELRTRVSLDAGQLTVAVDGTGAAYPVTIRATLAGLSPAPSAPSPAPNWSVESNQAGAGATGDTAGDVNGDGYSDVIVGFYGYDNGETGEGRAYLFYGSPTGLSATPAWQAESNQVEAFFGFGHTAGDVNGDGYDDVVVGAGYWDGGQTDEGAVFLYHGSAAGLSLTPNWQIESNQAYANFGPCSPAGDVNGDGFSDVLVSGYTYDNGETDEGKAFLYYGSAAGLGPTPGWTAEGNQSGANFSCGYTAGDVNGDGYDDANFGAGGFDNDQQGEGRAYVYYGSAGGLSPSPQWTAEGNQENAGFPAISTAGDVNGDGYDDVIVGAIYYDNDQVNEGRVWAYHGSAAGLSTSPAWTVEGNQQDSLFGYVASAGDVNGDGYGDVIVHAHFYDNGETNEGRVYIYPGSAAGLSTTPYWTVESNQAYAGLVATTAGDVNGDGRYSDILVTSPWYDNPEEGEGAAFVYHGPLFDIAPPVSSATCPTFATNAPISCTWTASDEFSGVLSTALWVKSGAGGSWGPTGLSQPGASGVFAYPPTQGDGTYYFATVATDYAGKQEAAPTGSGDDVTVFDTVAPSSSASSATYGGAGPIAVAWSASDATSGVASTALWVKFGSGGTWAFAGLSQPGNSGTFNYTPTLGDGTYYFASVATDNAGNVEGVPAGSGDDPTVIDTVAPSSSASSPTYSGAGQIAVGWTASDDRVGVASAALWVKFGGGGTWTDTGLSQPGASGTFSYVPTSGDGTYCFATVATDNVGNAEGVPAGSGDDSTIYETVPPLSTAISPDSDTGGTIPVAWVASDATSGVRSTALWVKFGSGGTWASTGYTQTGAAGVFDYPPASGDGAYYFATVATDVAGNVEALPTGSGEDSTLYDTAAPSSIAVSPDYDTGGPIPVVWIASDATSGVAYTELWFKFASGGDWSSTNLTQTGTAGSFNYTPASGDGVYYFAAVATDKVGNTEAGPGGSGDDSTVYDTARPSSSAGSPAYDNGSPIPVAWTASDATSGVASTALWVKFGGGPWANTGVSQPGTAGTFNYTPSSGDGSYYFATVAADRAGHVETAPTGSGDSVTVYDTAAPSSGATCPPTDNSSPISIVWSASDATSGVASTELWYKSAGGGAWTPSGLTQTGASGIFEYAPSADGTYFFATVAADTAGNQEAAPAGSGDGSTLYDSTPPSSGAAAPSYDNGGTIPLMWSASDATSGVAFTELWFKFTSGGDWAGTGLTQTGTAGTFNYPPASGDGAYYFATVATDNVGNSEPGPAGPGDDSTVYDTVPPTSGCSSPTYDVGGPIPITWWAGDATSGVASTALWAKVGGAGTWASTGLAQPGTAGTFNYTPAGDGSTYFAVVTLDNAGNGEGAPAGSGDCSTIYDTAAPTSSASSPTYDNGGTIPVTWTASDATSGVALVTLWFKLGSGGAWASTGLTQTGAAGAFAYPPAGGDGTYYFATVATDHAGNSEAAPTGPGDDSTIYDTAAPASSAASPPYDNSGPIPVGWSAADATSGVASTTLWVRYGAAGTWQNTGQSQSGAAGTFDYAPVHGDGSYFFATLAVDNAGNTEGEPTGPGDDSTVYDTAAPASSAASPPADDWGTIPVTWGASDATSGVALTTLWFKVGSGGLWANSGLAQSGTYGVFDFAPTRGGTYYFATVAVDNAGNIESFPAGSGDSSTLCRFHHVFLPTVARSYPAARAATGETGSPAQSGPGWWHDVYTDTGHGR